MLRYQCTWSKPLWYFGDRYIDNLQVRQFNNIDLDSLRYTKFDGMHQVEPAVDLSGKEFDSTTSEPPASGV